MYFAVLVHFTIKSRNIFLKIKKEKNQPFLPASSPGLHVKYYWHLIFSAQNVSAGDNSRLLVEDITVFCYLTETRIVIDYMNKEISASGNDTR